MTSTIRGNDNFDSDNELTVQKQSALYNTVGGTTTTVIPYDGTAPQNTEGSEFMTVTITPTDANNKLIIESVAHLQSSIGTRPYMISALFKDSDADAISSGVQRMDDQVNGIRQLSIYHEMIAGTTNPITFKIRCGQSAAGTVTFNPTTLGDTLTSFLKVTEVNQ